MKLGFVPHVPLFTPPPTDSNPTTHHSVDIASTYVYHIHTVPREILVNLLILINALLFFAFLAAGLRLNIVPLKLKLILISLSSLPALLNALYYVHLLDSVVLYYWFRAIPLTELLNATVGLGTGLLGKTFWQQKMRVAPLLLLPAAVALSLMPFVKIIFSPLNTDSLQDRWDGNYCRQTSAATCGPACLATVLSAAGKKFSEKEIAEECHTTATGTEAWYLARCARARGFGVRFTKLPIAELSGKRGIIGVKQRLGTGHFLALLSCDGTNIEYVDPISGCHKQPISEFSKTYLFTNFLIEIASANEDVDRQKTMQRSSDNNGAITKKVN